jgi:hypothetical protein
MTRLFNATKLYQIGSLCRLKNLDGASRESTTTYQKYDMLKHFKLVIVDLITKDQTFENYQLQASRLFEYSTTNNLPTNDPHQK